MACSKSQNISMYAIMGMILIGILIILVIVMPGIAAAFELECDGMKEPDCEHKVWVKLQNNSLIEQYEVMDEWNESKFNYYVRNRYPANAQGVSYFEHYFGIEETQFVEKALGISFDDPNSWNQADIDLRAKELENAIRYHQTEYGVAVEYDFSKQSTIVVPSDYDWNDHGDAHRKFTEDKISRTKVPDYEPDQQAIEKTQQFMVATMSTAGLIGSAAFFSNHKSRTNQVVAGLMLLILVAALVLGVFGMSGGNFEWRNDHFLQYTQYFTYIFFATMALVCIGGQVSHYLVDEVADDIRSQIKQIEQQIEEIESRRDDASYEEYESMTVQISNLRKGIEALQKHLANHLASKQNKISETRVPKIDRRLRRLLDATRA